MKKIIGIVVALCGIFLIGIGIATNSSLLEKNKTIVIKKDLKKQKLTTNMKYQQQIIKNIELAFQNGYTIAEGNSTIKTNDFLDTTKEEYKEYENCNGEVKFTNINNQIGYEITSTCKKDKNGLKVKYSLARLSEQNITEAKLIPTETGYFLVGTTSAQEKVLIKFDENHQITFIEKINNFPTAENENTYLNINDIFEDQDSYYVLGYIQNAKGSIFTNLLLELNHLYTKQSIATNDHNFSFLFKYDKQGNLISQQLIDPIKGDLSITNILGKEKDFLLLTSSTKIIKYDIKKETFEYIDLPETMLEPSYLKDNFIYAYTLKCNYDNNTANNNDSIMKLDLNGKVIWQQNLNHERKITPDTCSNYITNIYNLENKHALVYEGSKKITIYNNDGKQIVDIDYSKVAKDQKNPITVLAIEMKNNKLKLYYTNEEYLLVDTLDSNYKLINRYTTGLYDATSLLDNINDVKNIVTTDKGLTQLKLLKGNTITVMKIDYLNE